MTMRADWMHFSSAQWGKSVLSKFLSKSGHNLHHGFLDENGSHVIARRVHGYIRHIHACHLLNQH